MSSLPTVMKHRRYNCEPLERRIQLCSIPLHHLPPAPEFDWEIEQREAARIASEGPDGGPEAVSIVWTNRGQASDNFAATFGTSAGAARTVVDAVLDSWERIITSWNRSDATTTLQIFINMAPMPGGGGFGGNGAPDPNAPADGKPRTGSFTITRGDDSADPNDSNGWFLDPTPFDHSEFVGPIVNAYAGTTSASIGPDMFTVVCAELTHVLGLISDPGNSGGAWQGYLLEGSGLATNTGIPDVNGVFWAFDGPTVDHLMTSIDGGSPGPGSWGNIVHSAAAGTNINFDAKNWRGAVDVGNAFGFGGRAIPGFTMAHMLADAYGYSILEPAQFGTYYAVLNQTTGNLLVRGAEGVSNDQIRVSIGVSTLSVSVDVGFDVPGTGALSGLGNLPAFVSSFDLASVSSMTIEAGAGNDTIFIDSIDSGTPITVNGGNDNDTLNLSEPGGNLDTIDANITFNGQSGANDRLLLWDDLAPATFNDSYTFTSTTFDRSFFPLVTYATTESVFLFAQPGNNTTDISSSLANSIIQIEGRDGNDTLNFGTGNLGGGASGVLGNVIFHGQNGSDTVNVNDASHVPPETFSINSTFVQRSSGIFGVDYFTTELLNVSAGGSGDIININSTAAGTPLIVNAGGGSDTLNFGNGDASNIDSPVTFNGGVAFTDTININDQNNTTATLVVIDGDSVASFHFQPLNFSQTEALNYNGGSGVDTIVVDAAVAGMPLVVNANGANDVIQVNATAAGSSVVINGGNDDDTLRLAPNTDNLSNIAGAVSFFGQNGTNDNVELSDSSFAPIFNPYTITATTFTRSQFGGLTYGSTTEAFLLSATAALDDFNFQSSFAGSTWTINAGDSGDRLILGNAGTIDAIDGAIQFNGDGGNDSVIVNDESDATPATNYVLTSTLFQRTGFGNLGYATVEAFTINGGDGDNNFYSVESKPAAMPLTINAGSAGDSFGISQAANQVGNVQGTLTLNGAGGIDSLFAFSASTTAFITWNVTATSITHTPFLATTTTINYSGLESMELNSGSGFDTFSINSPGAQLSVNAGVGTDTINVTETAGANVVTLLSSVGNDTVNVNADNVGSAALRFIATQRIGAMSIGSGGSASVTPGGNKVLTASSLSIPGTGRLDLTDNDMIVDYSGASPLASIQSLLTSGYNGGAWNGNGINSSTAAALTTTAIGFAEATDIFSAFPAIFSGQSIDNTSIVMKYTFYGDADLSGGVNLNDFNRLAANFGATPRRWAHGNSDYDTDVDLNDFNRLAANFGSSGLGPEGSGAEPDEQPTVEELLKLAVR